MALFRVAYQNAARILFAIVSHSCLMRLLRKTEATSLCSDYLKCDGALLVR